MAQDIAYNIILPISGGYRRRQLSGALFMLLIVSWLLSAQLENASAKGRDRPFDSSMKG